MKAHTTKTNKEWHAAKRMPKNATLSQRIDWHKEHAQHCRCRPMPDKIVQAIAEGKH